MRRMKELASHMARTGRVQTPPVCLLLHEDGQDFAALLVESRLYCSSPYCLFLQASLFPMCTGPWPLWPSHRRRRRRRQLAGSPSQAWEGLEILFCWSATSTLRYVALSGCFSWRLRQGSCVSQVLVQTVSRPCSCNSLELIHRPVLMQFHSVLASPLPSHCAGSSVPEYPSLRFQFHSV